MDRRDTPPLGELTEVSTAVVQMLVDQIELPGALDAFLPTLKPVELPIATC